MCVCVCMCVCMYVCVLTFSKAEVDSEDGAVAEEEGVEVVVVGTEVTIPAKGKHLMSSLLGTCS